MSCDNCRSTLRVPQCADNLIMGTVATVNPVYVYFESIGTQRLNRYEATPVAGIVTINTPELAAHTSYKIWITEQSSEQQSEGLTITLPEDGGTTDVDCYLLRFSKPQAGNYTTIRVEL